MNQYYFYNERTILTLYLKHHFGTLVSNYHFHDNLLLKNNSWNIFRPKLYSAEVGIILVRWNYN